MPIIRCSDQNHQTLEQFYSDSNNRQTQNIGAAMLTLIKLLDTKFKDTTLFGLTSLYRLNLLASDSYTSPWYVSFISDGKHYHIDYLIPKTEQSAKHVRMTEEADSSEKAYRKILQAMTQSGGWTDNKELYQLLKEMETK